MPKPRKCEIFTLLGMMVCAPTCLKREFCTKINEQRHKHAYTHMEKPNAFNCTFPNAFLSLFLVSTFCVQKGITCSCRLQFFFSKKKSPATAKHQRKIPSAEWLFAKILIAFARYARCFRNNENYDKLQNLWCCSMCSWLDGSDLAQHIHTHPVLFGR